MHEYSITCSIVDILKNIAEEKKLGEIKKINFEINPIAYIEPTSIEFYFKFLTKEDSILKNSILSFKKAKVKLICKNCGNEFFSDNYSAECPSCLGRKLKLKEIDDIKIISIEV